MPREKWTEEQLAAAFCLYCLAPSKDPRAQDEWTAEAARKLGHPPSSAAMLMANFRSLDERVRGGAPNASAGARAVYEMYKNDWGALCLAAEGVLGEDLYERRPRRGSKRLQHKTDRAKIARLRSRFKKGLWEAYGGRCCVSGCAMPSLLAASHIKPMSACRTDEERSSPRNGLLLNVLYDDLFNDGYFSVSPDGYRIAVSGALREAAEGDAFVARALAELEGKAFVDAPADEAARPGPEYLRHHMENVFRG
jgi:hypothetical protein